METTDEDPVTLMLKKTGCIELHYKVQVTPSLVTFFPVFHLNFEIFLLTGVHCRNW
jgi:hypothetical protein